jgi:hypothetical protein
MTQIQDSIVQLLNSELANSSGEFIHNGDYTINGTVTVGKLVVSDSQNNNNVGDWVVNLETDLAGKGFNWTWGGGNTQLIYRTGGRIWTNGIIDLAQGSSYNIDDIPVLSAGELGRTITKSNLTKIGTLSTLEVSGDAVISDFAFFNSSFNRLGIGNEEPAASIDILDNNVNIVIGSPVVNLATIGTHSNHDLALITDGQQRIVIKNSGDINVVGNLHIAGKLTVTTIETDNRIDRSHPLQFFAGRDTDVYGLGLLWAREDRTRQFILLENPERIYSSESIEVGANQCYYIDGKPVVTSNGLGSSILTSNLNKVGVLESLSVAGDADFSNIVVDNITLNDSVQSLTINTTQINSSKQIKLTVNEKEIVYGDDAQVSIGDKSAQSKPVKIFGKLSVNINNPDADLNFAVNGDVHIGEKRFTNDMTIPTSGTYNKGDICWNQNPQVDSYLGWVCITSGTPGEWAGFGRIDAQ